MDVTNAFGCTDSDTTTTVLGLNLNPQIKFFREAPRCVYGRQPSVECRRISCILLVNRRYYSKYYRKYGRSFLVEVSVPIGCSVPDTVNINLVNNLR
ncbi:MAG: hypothetical protein R3B47_17295 [Bacteroidia bacterium]